MEESSNETKNDISGAKKKRILRWSEDTNEYLLLAIAETSKEKDCKFPWDKVAKKMGSETKASSILTHFGKLKKKRLESGKIVPPGPYLDMETPKPTAKKPSKLPGRYGVMNGAPPPRLAASRPKRYREDLSESSTEEVDSLEGKPEASYMPKSAKQNRRGDVKKASKFFSTKKPSNLHSQTNLIESDTSEKSYMVKLKCDPEALRELVEGAALEDRVKNENEQFKPYCKVEEGIPMIQEQKDVGIKGESKHENLEGHMTSGLLEESGLAKEQMKTNPENCIDMGQVTCGGTISFSAQSESFNSDLVQKRSGSVVGGEVDIDSVAQDKGKNHSSDLELLPSSFIDEFERGDWKSSVEIPNWLHDLVDVEQFQD